MITKRKMMALLLVVVLLLLIAIPAMAATTADVTVTFTPGNITMTDNATSYDYGILLPSTTTNTSTSYVGVDMTGTTIQSDVSIYVTGDWTDFTHSDTATPGADTVGMKANRGTWGTGDVIIKKTAAYNYIYENLPASTNFTYGTSLLTPTSYTTSDQQSNTLRISGAAG